MTNIRILLLSLLAPPLFAAQTTEFCLDGEFNLGARYQGLAPDHDEFTAARWCVVTEDEGERVLFSASGKSNPDLQGDWTVAYLPPDTVRIVNRGDPPDVEFIGASSLDEARRVRRIDPRRLIPERAGGPIPDVGIRTSDGRLQSVGTLADLPLRGRVPVTWEWDWADADHPTLQLTVEDDVLFRARGSWRTLDDDEAAALWEPTPGEEPVEVPGEHWPARIDMRLIELADDVWLVRGVRTGFQHMVVDNGDGLVVADAPTGWVEIHQIPPTDLVPGFGVSGLSEALIDFLGTEFPGRPVEAVALTHAHDDHAGGARAFAAAGAVVFAPAEYTEFLESALNRNTMPRDRFMNMNGELDVIPVANAVTLEGSAGTVRIMAMGPGPHATASLGLHAVDSGYFFVSDVHVPNSDAPEPRTNRVVTECWFARWAVDNLPPGTVFVNSHSAAQTTTETLRGYLESAACRTP